MAYLTSKTKEKGNIVRITRVLFFLPFIVYKLVKI